jgi:hypothetical protein
MTRRIAICGHRGLPPAVVRSVDAAFRVALLRIGEPVVGLSCLAEGADTIGARAVLDADGLLEAVIPARKYRQALPPEHRADYDELRRLADRVHELDSDDATPRSYQAASEFMLDHADTLWAVWDGRPARGYGGTADVVSAARGRGLPIQVFWPDGAVR